MVSQVVTMGIDTINTLVPALRSLTRPVYKVAEPSFPPHTFQSQIQSRSTLNNGRQPGEPLGTYDESSKMTYPASGASGRIVNVYA